FRLSALRLVLLGAGRWHSRTTDRWTVIAKIATGLLTLEQGLDLIAGQRFILQQAFCHNDKLVMFRRQYVFGFIIGFIDQTADLVVYLLGCRFRYIFRLGNRMAEENFLLVLAVGDLAELIGKAPLRYHRPSQLRGLFDIGGCTRRDV